MTKESSQTNASGPSGRPSLVDLVSAPSLAATPVAGLTQGQWTKIAILGGLFAVMNLWQFWPLVGTWLHNPNWTHGFIIPLFSLYLIFIRREEFLAARPRVCMWGLAIMIVGIIGALAGFYPIRNWWISELSMVVTLLGLVLYLGGPEVIRLAWLPIAFLALAMPIPDILYSRLALPLQNLAAMAATSFLKLAGVKIEVAASNLTIESIGGATYSLTVAEACSGVRSLMAYVALAVAWAYLEDRPIWQRVTLVAAAIPIAIAVNMVRVIITCVMNVIDRPELGKDFMHEITGVAMLVPALGLFWLLGWVLSHLFVPEEEPDDDRPSAPEASR